MVLRYRRDLKQKARALRSSMTDAEQKLWARLRRKQALGIQFYRQRPIGNFVVDFYAPSARLVVEVDGSQHFAHEEAKRDLRRDEHLIHLGLRVLRFDNRQVLQETEAVTAAIHWAVLEKLTSGEIPPGPPLRKGGNHGQSAVPSLRKRGNRNQAASEREGARQSLPLKKAGTHENRSASGETSPRQSLPFPTRANGENQSASGESSLRQFPPLKKGG